jgi:outer membrane murein-binding lipoprotein Lpp
MRILVVLHVRPVRNAFMKTLSRIVLAATVATVIAGCSSKEKVDFQSITRSPAPEMASTAGRPVDMDADYAYMRNTNYRAFWDDVQRTLYIDNPSRLSPFPIVEMSGNPR